LVAFGICPVPQRNAVSGEQGAHQGVVFLLVVLFPSVMPLADTDAETAVGIGGAIGVNYYEAALKKAGVSYEFHRYDGAGHGFQDFNDSNRYRKDQS
jgi:acetyl esterase/lipase